MSIPHWAIFTYKTLQSLIKKTQQFDKSNRQRKFAAKPINGAVDVCKRHMRSRKRRNNQLATSRLWQVRKITSLTKAILALKSSGLGTLFEKGFANRNWRYTETFLLIFPELRLLLYNIPMDDSWGSFAVASSIIVNSKDNGLKLPYDPFVFNLSLVPIRCEFPNDI
jgi:hypothetical protein